MMDADSIKFAERHSLPGSTSIVVQGSCDDGLIITGGADGEVKCSKVAISSSDFDDNNIAMSIETMDEKVLVSGEEEVTALALSPHNNEILVGLKNGHVNTHEFPSGNFKGTVTRFAAVEVNDVGYFCKQLHVSCSEHPGITLSSMKQPSNRIVIDERNDSGTRSLAIDPLGEYIAAVGLDGKLRIHYVPRSCLQSFAENDNFENKSSAIDVVEVEENVLSEACMNKDDGSEESRRQVGQCCWHPHGNYLALAGRTNIVIKHRPEDENDRSEWREEVIVSTSHHHLSPISCLTFCDRDGKLLASGCLEKSLIIWDVGTMEPLKKLSGSAEPSAFFSSIQCLPKPAIMNGQGAVLCLADGDGKLGVLSIEAPPLVNKIETKKGGRVKESVGDTLIETDEEDFAEVNGGNPLKDIDEEDDDDFDFDTDEEANKLSDNLTKNKSKKEGSTMMDTEANDEDIKGKSSMKSVFDNEDDESENALGSDSDDEQSIDLNSDDDEVRSHEDEVVDDAMASSYPVNALPAMAALPLQAPFMTSSTPVTDQGLFCWNQVGTISFVTNSDDTRTFDIEFADVTAHRTIHFNDRVSLTMGALSNTCAVFANCPEDTVDEGLEEVSELVKQSILKQNPSKRTPSSVHCRVFNASSSAGASWIRRLDDGEKASVVAAGDDFVAVVTDRGLVRVFGLGGLETDVFCASGPVLSAVGQGSLLFLLTHQAPAVMGDETPQVTYQVLDMQQRVEVSRGRLPMQERGEVTWVGFATPHNMPSFMNSSGVLYGLSNSFGGSWVPLFDSKKAGKGRVWPVAVQYSKLSFASMKSGLSYPTTHPRPLVSTVPLVVPSSNDKHFDTLECSALSSSSLLRVHWEESDMREVANTAVDKILLKLMKSACDAERYETALDAARQLNSQASFKIALMIADRSSLASLVPRVQFIMEAKFGKEEEEEEEEVEEEGEEQNQHDNDFEEDEQEDKDEMKVNKGQKRTYQTMDRKALRFSAELPQRAKISPEARRAQLRMTPKLVDDEAEWDEFATNVAENPSQLHHDDDDRVTSPTNESWSLEDPGAAEALEQDTEDEEEVHELLNNEEELQSSPTPLSPQPESPVKKRPFNPFGKKHGSIASPPPKGKSVFELLGGMQASPVKKLSRDSSFSIEARQKQFRKRSIL